MAFRVSARRRSSSRATGTATRSCSRSVRMACASDVICSSGRRALRAIQKPTRAVVDQRDGTAEQQQDEEFAHIVLDALEAQGHDEEAGRGGVVQRGDQNAVALPFRTEPKSDHLEALPAGGPEQLGTHQGLRPRQATVVEDHLPVLGQHLGNGVGVRQHRLRRVFEVPDLIGWSSPPGSDSSLLSAIASAMATEALGRLLIGVAVQVRPELDDEKRAQRGQRGGEQGHVPRRQSDSDGQVHEASRTNPLPRTVRMSRRLLGRSSFFRSWPM